MNHEMKLTNSAFQRIKSGRKTIELRLLDEKRKKLSLGDKIIFSNVDLPSEQISVTVVDLLKFNSFRDLFNEIDLSDLGHKTTYSIEDLIIRLRKFYSEEDERNFGVVGIVIKLNVG